MGLGPLRPRRRVAICLRSCDDTGLLRRAARRTRRARITLPRTSTPWRPASLYLICVDSEVTLASAVTYAKAQGISIVTHWTWSIEPRRRLRRAGNTRRHRGDARANGILRERRSNEAERHWLDTLTTRTLNQASSSSTRGDDEWFHRRGRCDGMRRRQVGRLPTTTEDYDPMFHSLDPGTPYVWSENEQRPGGPPTEETCFTNTGWKRPGVQLGDLQVCRDGCESRVSTSSSSFGPIERAYSTGSIAGAGVVSRGARCRSRVRSDPWSSRNSARGPTIDGRTKPGLVAPGAHEPGVYGDSGTCGSDGFPGTKLGVASPPALRRYSSRRT